MKKFLFYVLSVFVLVLAACGNSEDTSSEEDGVATGESTNEMSELEEENEELRRQLEEQEDENGNDEASEEAEAGSDDNETESSDTVEGTESEDNQNDNTEGDRSDLVFDINSSEVQSQLIGTNSGNNEGNFEQDAITIGMSQTEVEEMYGAYDFSFYYQGAAPAFYENLAVVYSELGPYGQGDGSDASMNDINPDENIIESVYYYAGITESEMIEALGEPDDQDDGSRSMNGLPHYIYEGEGEDGRYYTTGASTINTPQGERIGLIMRGIHEENPNEANQSTVNEEDIPVTEEPDPNAEIKDEYDYEYLLTEYLQRLAAHYNMVEYDDVYYYLKRGSAAYDKIAENKASGHFTGHETIDVELIELTDLGDGTVELNADRVYSHDNSEGQRIANVNYIVNAETHEVLDFEPVSDEAY